MTREFVQGIFKRSQQRFHSSSSNFQGIFYKMSYVVYVCINPIFFTMASSSKNLERKEVLNIQLSSNEVKQPNFKAIPDIAYKQDPLGMLSLIPQNVIMVQDVRKC